MEANVDKATDAAAQKNYQPGIIPDNHPVAEKICIIRAKTGVMRNSCIRTTPGGSS